MPPCRTLYTQSVSSCSDLFLQLLLFLFPRALLLYDPSFVTSSCMPSSNLGPSPFGATSSS